LIEAAFPSFFAVHRNPGDQISPDLVADELFMRQCAENSGERPHSVEFDGMDDIFNYTAIFSDCYIFCKIPVPFSAGATDAVGQMAGADRTGVSHKMNSFGAPAAEIVLP
jgi:hypothetical protein